MNPNPNQPKIYQSIRFERRKSKPTRKLKHANSILEYFEYFCQMYVIKINPYNFELYRPTV